MTWSSSGPRSGRWGCGPRPGEPPADRAAARPGRAAGGRSRRLPAVPRLLPARLRQLFLAHPQHVRRPAGRRPGAAVRSGRPPAGASPGPGGPGRGTAEGRGRNGADDRFGGVTARTLVLLCTKPGSGPLSGASAPLRSAMSRPRSGADKDGAQGTLGFGALRLGIGTTWSTSGPDATVTGGHGSCLGHHTPPGGGRRRGAARSPRLCSAPSVVGRSRTRAERS